LSNALTTYSEGAPFYNAFLPVLYFSDFVVSQDLSQYSDTKARQSTRWAWHILASFFVDFAQLQTYDAS
jgi:hypothetical protein